MLLFKRPLHLNLLLLVSILITTYSGYSFAKQDIKDELNLDWGEWNQSIMEVDIYTLPLTPQQHEILNSKINQLKQKYGVGIVGDIELAISQMDSSNLLNESKRQSNNTAIENRNPLIKDDLLLEEEIKALEFAKSMEQDDPEGLKGKTIHSQALFNKILNQLEQLEQKNLTEKVN